MNDNNTNQGAVTPQAIAKKYFDGSDIIHQHVIMAAIEAMQEYAELYAASKLKEKEQEIEELKKENQECDELCKKILNGIGTIYVRELKAKADKLAEVAIAVSKYQVNTFTSWELKKLADAAILAYQQTNENK